MNASADQRSTSGACDRCGGQLSEVSRPKAIEEAGRVIVVRGVPVHECGACGEVYLNEDVAETLDQLLTDLLAGSADVAVATYPTSGPPGEAAARATLGHATFDSLARQVSEARRYARMLLHGRNSGIWDPGWFGVPDDEKRWPSWLTSVGGDYAATTEVPPRTRCGHCRRGVQPPADLR